MRASPVCLSAILMVSFSLVAQTPATEMKGMPPRATPGDYQAQGKAGNVTIAAEFMQHSVPKPEGPLSTEDYVVVEVGFFGQPGERLQLSVDDFSLRVNNGKKALPGQPFGLVTSSLKDPEWSPPEESEPKQKSKGGLSTGGGGGDSAPPVVHVPIELRRAMAQYLQKAALAEGDRPLPQAGLIFFSFHAKTKGIRSLELIYNGPAGKTTLALQP
jgi:hypothetical protein